jgi:hypothetical protein
MAIEGFIGIELTRMRHEQDEARASHGYHLTAIVRSGSKRQPSLRARAGNVMIQAGGVIAGTDITSQLNTSRTGSQPQHSG